MQQYYATHLLLLTRADVLGNYPYKTEWQSAKNINFLAEITEYKLEEAVVKMFSL